MSIIEAWKTCVLQKYATFSGRGRRSEYWGFVLANVVIYFAFLVLTALSKYFLLAYLAFAIAMLVPTLAAGVRRLHDTGKSGWALLLALIPIVGSFVLLVFMVTEGDRTANDYGVSPK